MKLFSLILTIIVFAFNLQAKSIKPDDAKKLAKNFYWEQSSEMHYDSINPKICYTGSIEKQNTFYVFNFENRKGFVMISADDLVKPVLAYSFKNKFDIDNIPVNARDWFEYYSKLVITAKKELTKQNSEISKLWRKYNLRTRKKNALYRASVDELLETTWNQNKYYNEDCPEDNGGPDGHVYAGCIATAMAQIMKYHSYPTQGVGSHSYTHPVYGVQSANFGETTYEWDNMPDNVTSYNDDVAQILYHCGVSVDMNYGPNGSSAYMGDAADAFVTYFAYSDDLDHIYKSNYSDSDWKNLLKNQLNNALPIMYAGSGSSGGHAFVCDGYDDSDYFHFNWGWSGSCDGYYALDDLTPCGYDFTNDQRAIINIYGENPFPECTYLISPQNGDTDVDVNADLEWEEAENATGYILTIGTTPGGNDILDEEDVGDVTTYDPGHLPYNTTIYVNITPYNDFNSASDCDEESFETEQFDYASAFKLNISIDNNNESFTIPTVGNGYFYDVDWGDGVITYDHTGNATHTYEYEETYIISIIGEFPRIYFYNSNDKDKVLSVYQWGNIEWQSMAYAFYGCENMVVGANDVPDLSAVSDMLNMFEGASSLTGYYIKNWDVSNITDMSSMFEGASIFNENLNDWDVSNVMYMNSMFMNAASFNKSLNDWDVSSVTDMTSMFENANSFDQELGDWDVSNVEYMTSMFENAGSFDQYINSWDVGNVIDMTSMFKNAGSFNRNLDGWDVSSVTDMTSMFENASSFDQDLGDWNVGNVTDMTAMFENVELSTINYDSILIKWEEQNLKQNVSFSGGNSKYCDGEQARTNLIDDMGWDIIDDGKDCPDLNCTNLIDPVDGSTGVPIYQDLSWNAVNYADGYFLSIGTTSGGNDILDDEDVGDVTTYDPGDFPCGTTIYVTIVPYNDEGGAYGCYDESFETEYVVANAGEDVEVCEGSSVQLNASGGTIYSWTPADYLDDSTVANPWANPPVDTDFIVTVSNDGRCPDTDTVRVIVLTGPVPNASATAESATGANDGTATSNPTGGSPEYTYMWSTGDTTQTITGLAPGMYYVTVTDSKLCQGIDSAEVQQFLCQNLSIDIIQNNVSCYGLCDGLLAIDNVVNGKYPYIYEWSNGSTDSLITGLCAGNYSVTVTDANNCNTTGNYEISQPEILQIVTNSTDETANNANDGTASVVASGGTSPYVYNWSNGMNTPNISNLSPGTYHITVTDANNCNTTDSITVAEFICPEINIISQTSNVSCFGQCDGSISIDSIINGVSPFTYSWSDGTTESGINNLCQGTYSVTITDTKNCSVTDTFGITQPDEIIITVDSTRDVRIDPPGYIAVSTNDNGNYTFSWSGPGDFTADTEDLDSLNNAGCYTLTVLDTLTGCSRDTTLCISDKTISEDLIYNKIHIYPNPAYNDFIVEIGETNSILTEINIYDISGKNKININTGKNKRLYHIDTGVFNSGLYIIEVKFENGKSIYKKLAVNK